MKSNTKKSPNLPKKNKTQEVKKVDFTSNRKQIYLPVLIAFCISVLIYLQTLSFGLTYFDDEQLIQNNIPFIKDFNNAPQAFLTDAFTDRSSYFYRPLQTISYMVDIHLSGENKTWMYHLSNILLLGFISCLLFLLLRRFKIPLKLALLSTLVYSAHPLFVSSIAWIPARGDLQLMLFSLLSFLFLIDFLQQKKTVFLILHWITFTVALFCKETAVFLPLLFIMYYFFFSSEKRFAKKYLITLVLYAISVISWFWIRTKAIGDFTNSNEVLGVLGRNDEVGLTPILRNLRTIPESLTNFFIPYDISPIPEFTLIKTLLGIVIIFLFGVLFFKNKKNPRKEKLFYLLWFLLLLLPTMLYKSDVIDYLHHRFFLPLVGIILFVLTIFPDTWYKKNDIKNSWIIVVVLIVLSSITIVKARSYSDSMTFYNAAISQNSNCAFAYNNRGNFYNAKGLYDQAINDYTKAIQLNMNYDQAYYGRGFTYNCQGLKDSAINDYTKAIQCNPNYIEAYNNRGILYNDLKLYDKAISDYSKAIQLMPDFAEPYNNRGYAYSMQGLYDKAINDYTIAIELKPNNMEAYYNRGDIYKKQGLTDKANQDFKKAEELSATAVKGNGPI
jgi:tetratricopeptide (TPR) repeat protein